MKNSPMTSLEAECMLISCIIIGDSYAIDRCISRKVESEIFSDRRNKILYESLKSLHERGLSTDMDMLLEDLKGPKLEEVGFDHIVMCSKAVGGLTQVDYFISRLTVLWKMRQSTKIAMEIIEGVAAIQPDADTFNQELMPKVTRLSEFVLDDKDERLQDVIARVKEDFITRSNGGEAIGDNIKLGIDDIDRRLTPLNARRDKYVVIAARPSVGKTSLATQIMQNLLREVKGSVVLDFQLENSRDNHIQQMAARAAKINLEKVDEWTDEQREKFTKYLDALSRIAEKRLFVYEHDLTIEQIESRARWVKRKMGKISLIVIDYIQLVGTDNKRIRGEREVVNHVSRKIKLLGKEIGCPILVLAQLSREHQKQGKEPQLQDLKESGNIEADADRVWMLHVKENARMDKETGCIATALLQRKNKYGRTGRVNLVHQRTTTTFFASAGEDKSSDEEEK